MKKHKEIALILLIVICILVAVSFLGKPLRSLLITFGLPSLNAKFSSIIILRTFILLVTFWGIHKLRFQQFNGFGDWFKIRHFQAWFSILLFCGMVLVVNFDLYSQTTPLILALFLGSNIAIGLTEELIFRGTILPLFISYFKSKKSVLIISVTITSLIFGIGHYMNLLNQPLNFQGITNQVVLATSIGMVAGTLVLRTKNILFVSLLHGILNISLSTRNLNVSKIHSAAESTQGKMEWVSILLIILLCLLLIIVSLYLIKKVNSKATLRSLNL